MSVSEEPVNKKNTALRKLALTNHIVAVLIAYQVLQVTVPFIIHRGQDVDNLLPLLGVPKLDTRLNHVTGELVLRVIDDVRCD